MFFQNKFSPRKIIFFIQFFLTFASQLDLSDTSFTSTPSNFSKHFVVAFFARVFGAKNVISARNIDLEGDFHGIGDPEIQADNACKCIKQLLEEAGASVTNICKLNTYITDARHREAVYAVIARHFKDVYPCGTGVVVQALATPEMLVEIDATAVV